jgi:dipeptidyl aminopeptidase/acylaminoacyl peptidase
MTRIVLILLAGILLVSACGPAESTPTLPDPAVTRTSSYVEPVRDDPMLDAAIPTPTAIPTGIPTGTPTAAPPPSPTPPPTATPPFPLSIEYLRVQEYPPSELVIKQVLDPGANYQRYIASYLSEGLRINALLTVPDGEKPPTGWPVIIFNHGYIPPDEYRTTERYVNYVDGFARRGYIVLRSDYRGHADSEGVARGAYGNPDYTVDVLNAVAAVRTFPDADPGRIGMWGHSMGGYITLRAMVATDDIKAGVIWAGVVASYEDLVSRWRRPGSAATPSLSTTRRRWRDLLSETYGNPAENPEFWASISANSYLGDLSGPLQLHHGTADTSVPVEFSTELAVQVREAGGYTEYYVYDGDNHNLSINFSEAMLRSILFFDEYVKGE